MKAYHHRLQDWVQTSQREKRLLNPAWSASPVHHSTSVVLPPGLLLGGSVWVRGTGRWGGQGSRCWGPDSHVCEPWPSSSPIPWTECAVGKCWKRILQLAFILEERREWKGGPRRYFYAQNLCEGFQNCFRNAVLSLVAFWWAVVL